MTKTPEGYDELITAVSDQTTLTRDEAYAIVEFRSNRDTVKPFGKYRAGLVNARLRRAKDPHALACEIVHSEQQKEELQHWYLRAVYEYDELTGAFRKRETGKVLGSIGNHGYLEFSVCNRVYLAHRLAWFYVNGVWPKEQIDHIDHNRTNNRYANLRECNNQQNCWNQNPYARRDIHKGVHLDRRSGKWAVTMRVAGRTKYLGRYETEEQAIVAFKAAERKYRGHFLGAS